MCWVDIPRMTAGRAARATDAAAAAVRRNDLSIMLGCWAVGKGAEQEKEQKNFFRLPSVDEACSHHLSSRHCSWAQSPVHPAVPAYFVLPRKRMPTAPCPSCAAAAREPCARRPSCKTIQLSPGIVRGQAVNMPPTSRGRCESIFGYSLLQTIGSGAFSTVKLAKHGMTGGANTPSPPLALLCVRLTDCTSVSHE